MTSYIEFARLFTETKDLLAEMNFQKISEKMNIASALANSYSKGIEMTGKTLTMG